MSESAAKKLLSEELIEERREEQRRENEQDAAPVQGFGYWTADLVKSSDPEQVAAILNRRYDALLRLWNEVPGPFKKIAEEGLRLG